MTMDARGISEGFEVVVAIEVGDAPALGDAGLLADGGGGFRWRDTMRRVSRTCFVSVHRITEVVTYMPRGDTSDQGIACWRYEQARLPV